MKIIELLRTYTPTHEKEKQDTENTIAWIEKYGMGAFVRENLEGHITGSMLVVDPTYKNVLLMHHKKLNRWQQFGGHSDGDTDSEQVAIREFQEESGIQEIPKSIQLFDIDAHRIPERGNEPEHTHFDIVFIGVVPQDTQFIAREAEVNDIRWFSLEEAKNIDSHDRVLKMLDKIETFAR